MALGKILRLGGIDNSAPKTDQSVGRFRVARNVLPTPDGTIIPRYDFEIASPSAPNVREYLHITEYDGSSLEFVAVQDGSSGDEKLQLYKSGVRVPNWVSRPPVPISIGTTSQGFQSTRVNNTTYVLTPGAQTNLMKYDGVEFGPAGCPLLQVATNSFIAGNYLRVMTHTIDFDLNQPISEYVQFRTSTTGPVNFFLNGQTPSGYVKIPDVITDVEPTVSYPTLYSGYNSFEGTATFSAVNDEFTITSTFNNITTTDKVGSYVFVAGTQGEMISMNFLNPVYYGLALKVKSVSGGTLRLDQKDAYLMTADRQWEKRDLTDTEATNVAGQIRYGTKYYVSFWEGQSTTGPFFFRAMHPIYQGTNTTLAAPWYRTVTMTNTATPTAGFDATMFSIGSEMTDFYDVESVKLSPNVFYPYDSNSSFYAMTKYQNQLLLATENYIWYSDTSLGGWIEQLNTANFLIIGDKEFGRITSICATNDFLLVSRERKNYYVTGNIATGNYRVQEVPSIDVGAWCNNSSINVNESVMFITAVGIYQMFEGGRCEHVSQRTPKNFDNYTSNNVNEDVVFRLVGTNSKPNSLGVPFNQYGLAVAFDPYRDLLVWMMRYGTNPCIVLHTKTGELYEWENLGGAAGDLTANCLAFIQAKYYIGMADRKQSLPYTATAYFGIENKSLLKTYQSTNPAKLYTAWMTAGEPSLEKELLQLKIFGRISAASANPLIVKHYKDWDISTPITNTTYLSQSPAALNSQIQYSHKKRLNSDKCLAASVGIEGTANLDFEIESFEVEFNAIQTGMKR